MVSRANSKNISRPNPAKAIDLQGPAPHVIDWKFCGVEQAPLTFSTGFLRVRWKIVPCTEMRHFKNA